MIYHEEPQSRSRNRGKARLRASSRDFSVLAAALLVLFSMATSAQGASFVDVTYDLSDTTGSTASTLGGGLLTPTTDIPPDGFFSGTMKIRYASNSQSEMPISYGPTTLLTFNLYAHATLYTGTAVTTGGGTVRTKLGSSDLHFELVGGSVSGGLLTAPGTILGGGTIQLRITGMLHCFILCTVGLDIPKSVSTPIQPTTITVSRPTLSGAIGPAGGAFSTRHTLSGVQYAAFILDPGDPSTQAKFLVPVTATTRLVGREVLREALGHDPKVIPEPGTLLLLAAGLIALAGAGWRRVTC